MKILHTADWHIGSFKGPEKEGVNLRSEDTMKCLRSLVETAEKEKPDLVLVSGDIFHQAEIWQGRSHKEVLQAREIILALSRAAGQVIVMRGTPNHDSEEAFLELVISVQGKFLCNNITEEFTFFRYNRDTKFERGTKHWQKEWQVSIKKDVLPAEYVKILVRWQLSKFTMDVMLW